ncbi:MAG: glutamate transporter glutamate-binding protein [Pseudonocardia sp.]|jgi:glutamate transport system substrate-binding protein|uniref:glutamate ABC transporter substrate-binding protein n=1 Tax=Pseudonocardia sp. TaxID=60912 RepID=UPI0026257F28|nr:glutamate ABC transporter substrate-binding protein [Pseudonocardia sp.]MCU1628412.1 glutamate transporter glutamate-binding protein [Pseudonocardia sp.]MDT7698201.1 glutamate transport system substrate-binding protein [Pseudonocardiales bacterium]
MANTVRRLAAAALAGLAVAALAACGGPDGEGPNPSPTPVPGAAPNGRLTIGIPFDEPGIGLKDGTSYRGFDVETATYVAKALGVPEANITWKEANGADREQLLTSGQADLILSTYSITDARKQVVDFAGPYFLAHQDLLVRRNETEITGPETLNGKDLCSVPGTTSAANVLQRYQGRIRLKELPTFSDCVQALADSQVDAVTTDDVILAGYAAEPQYRGALKVVGKGFSDESYGVGVRKGNTALRDQVNAALKQYVADGSWRRALGITVAPSGYQIPDPPTPGTA